MKNLFMSLIATVGIVSIPAFSDLSGAIQDCMKISNGVEKVPVFGTAGIGIGYSCVGSSAQTLYREVAGYAKDLGPIDLDATTRVSYRVFGNGRIEKGDAPSHCIVITKRIFPRPVRGYKCLIAVSLNDAMIGAAN